MRIPALLLYSAVLWSLVGGDGLLGGLGDVLKDVGNPLGGQPTGGQTCNCSKDKNCATCGNSGGLGPIGKDLAKNVGGVLGPVTGQNGTGQGSQGLGEVLDDVLEPLTKQQECGNCPQGQNCQPCQGDGLGDVLDDLAGGILSDLAKGTLGDLTPVVQGLLGALQPVVSGLLAPVQGLLGLVLSLVSTIVTLLLKILGLAGPFVSQVLSPLVSLLNSTGAQAGQGKLVASLLDNLKKVVSQILSQAGPNAGAVLGPLLSLLENLGKEAAKIGKQCPCGQNTNQCPCTQCPCQPNTNQCPCQSKKDSEVAVTTPMPTEATTETPDMTEATTETPDMTEATTETPDMTEATTETTAMTTTESPPENDVGPNGEIVCPGRLCLADCVLTSCRVVCLETGCTVDGLLILGTFQDLLTQAKKMSLGYAGTVTGYASDDEDDVLFGGQLGQAMSEAGFNPNAFIGSFGIVPDASESMYRSNRKNYGPPSFNKNGGRPSTPVNNVGNGQPPIREPSRNHAPNVPTGNNINRATKTPSGKKCEPSGTKSQLPPGCPVPQDDKRTNNG